MKFFTKFFLLLLLTASVLSGSIYPKTPRPILLSQNNYNSFADYTFSYQISSYIPPDALLSITFPTLSYAPGLGLSPCLCTNWNSISLPCTVTDTTVSLSVGELSNANSNNTYNITIHNIQNPSIGGTSMFQLQLIRGINVLDYSDFFADIGIMPALSAITTATISCLTNCVAGLSSTYSLTYTTTALYEVGARIFIQFPSTLSLPSPISCVSAEISGITCGSSAAGLVSVSLLTAEISAGTSLTFVFSAVKNPAVSGLVGNFGVYAMAPVVNTVVEQVQSIPGPSLAANSIASVVVCPGGPSSYCIGYYPYVSLTNTQPYYLTITTTNPVPNGGVLFVTFLASFTLQANYCLVTNGLKNQGYTEDDQILCLVDTSAGTLTITKFKAFAGGTFSLTVIATNPGTANTYSPLAVTTYYDAAKTQVIDTGSMGYITVVNIPPPQTWQVSWNLPLVVNTIVQASITFQPFTNGLDSSTVSFKFYFPSAFTFTGTVLGYLTPHDVFPELVVTPTISGTYMQIPSATVAQPYTNSLNAENRVRVAGAAATDGVLLPAMPGTYFIEMVTSFSGTDIEATLYECQVLPNVMPGSVLAFSYDVLKDSLYQVTFTPTITIPQGTVPELPQKSWGTFDIWFPTMNTNLQTLWLTDLGTGLQTLDVVPCKAIQNITPVNGDNILCRLITAGSVATNTYATVRVTNFQIIYLNVPVTIHIANIQNPGTPDVPAAVTVATYQITQRIYQELNQVNFTYPHYFYLNTNPALPKTNGRSPPPIGDGLNQIVFLPNTVNVASMVTFILWTESDILSGGNFYLKFPSSYPLLQNSISCYINYATQLACYTYPDAGWISILNLAFTMTNHVEYTFTIRYLQNPRHQVQPALSSAVAISSAVEIEYIYFSAFAYLDPGAISPVNVYPSSYKALAVATSYYWIFTPTNSLPVGSQIILSFPKADYVLNTDPLPLCTIVSGLTAVDSLSSILCTISGASIIITNFAQYTGGSQISVTILNILNPSTKRLTDYFQIQTYDETGLLVDQNAAIAKITIQAALAVGLLTYVDFYANPSNGYAVADYTISILPSVSVPAGSLINLIFPQAEFGGLSASQSCSIAGGLTTLSSCYGDTANTITVVTDAYYTKNSLSLPINITVYSLTNFQPMLTSGLLEVGITTSAVTINTSPDSENNRKITTTAKAGAMSLLMVYYAPITAGERAVYNFTFVPTHAFLSTCSVVIKFPNSFSRGLAEFVYCYSPEISLRTDSSVKCQVSGRVLEVYNTGGWDPANSTNFTISVQHVRNPTSAAGQPFIFYSQCGYAMVDYGSSLFPITFTQLPTVMYLTSGYSAGNTVLYDQETISLSAYNLAPYTSLTSDQILIDFPIDYNLAFVGTGITGNAVFAGTAYPELCSYEPNRAKLQAFAAGIDTSLVHNYTASLSDIENPAVVQTARYISLGIYKNSVREVYAKTYSNLNRNQPFSYIQQGLAVIVNALQTFSINIGTSVDSLTANIPSGAQTVFSIQGSISDRNCYISPNPIDFSIRSFYQTFSVSCSPMAVLGEQYITWEFLGTWPSSYWSPIQRTYFTIVNTNNDLISVQDIGEVPIGGQSLPIIVTLTHSPESFLVIQLFTVGSLPSNVTLSPNTLNFTRGVTELTFRVIIDAGSIGLSGKVYLAKSGSDAEYFTMQRSLLSYDVGPKDTTLPVVVEFKTLGINNVNASFSLTVDTPCVVYWMVGRYGTRAPTISEAINGTLLDVGNLQDTPIFGETFTYTEIASNRFGYTITALGLIAQTNYTIHIFSKDNGGNIAAYIPTIDFTTVNRYRIATFPMYFTLDMTSTQIQNALNETADVLGISHSLVIIRTDYSGSTGSPPISNPDQTEDYVSSSGLNRLLQNTTEIDVLVIPIPTQDLRPLDLVNSLQTSKFALSNIAGLNTSYTITGQEIYGILPVFKSTPTLGSVIGGVLTLVNLSLFYQGFISICVMVYNASYYIEPISWQINNLLDMHNYPCNMSQVIEASEIPTQAFFQGILSDTEYRVLITAKNTLQVYPDFMYDVKVINFTTYGMAMTNSTSYGNWILCTGFVVLLGSF